MTSLVVLAKLAVVGVLLTICVATVIHFWNYMAEEEGYEIFGGGKTQTVATDAGIQNGKPDLTTDESGNVAQLPTNTSKQNDAPQSIEHALVVTGRDSVLGSETKDASTIAPAEENDKPTERNDVEPTVSLSDVMKAPDDCKGRRAAWHGEFQSMEGNRALYVSGADDGSAYHFYADYEANAKPTEESGLITGTIKGTEILTSSSTASDGLRISFVAVPVLTDVSFEPDKK